MGMTSKKEIIKKLTGLEIGNVYLNGVEYVAQNKGDRQLDYDSGNFHLFPIIEDNQVEKWRCYFIKEKQIIDGIGKLLEEEKKNYNLEFSKITIGKGTLDEIPEEYKSNKMGVNCFFRTITLKKDNRYYVILLKRFYIDKANKVNCIFGNLQFYSSLNGGINEDDKTKSKIAIGEENKYAYPKIIHYPKSYKDQNEKMIRISDTNQKVVVYNPKIRGTIANGSINEISKDTVKLFIEFVNYVESKK